MGTKREAVRKIIERVPEWPGPQFMCIRIDADGEILGSTVPAHVVIANEEGADAHKSLAGPLYRHRPKRKAAWFIEYLQSTDVWETTTGLPIDRFEFEILKAGILAEKEGT